MTGPQKLKQMADKLRVHSLKMTTKAGSGHPTTCMSMAEITSVLFFSEMKKGDEFVLSKGHAAPILWAAYAEAGLIPVSRLTSLRKITSNLEGHPTPRMPLVKIATGSLGQGLSAGVGMALGFKLKKNKNRVFVVLGDGEVAEGSVWEAANSASYNKLNNLIAIIDVNRLGQSQPTMFGHKTKEYVKRFSAFGWNTIRVNGHSVRYLLKAFEKAKKSKKPVAIIAKTYKGKGVSFIQNKEGWHGKPLSSEDLKKALKKLGDPQVKLKSGFSVEKSKTSIKSAKKTKYEIGKKVATRQAFGNALLNIGKANRNVVAVDGDTKNSTMSQDFFNKYPERSFEAFIAEQNMVGIAAGLSAVGFVPFASTFGAFFTRAHDQIRMAAYSQSNIKLIGSHGGVSIGEDGPSQMGLEDLPMFLSIPNAVVLYPSDAVSTEALVESMAKYNGIAYMKTTRGKMPTIYKSTEKFSLGEFKVIKKSKSDKVLVIAAGVTLFEALDAYEKLKKKGINIRVVDLYSLQPLNEKELIKEAKECGHNVLVVEDNYFGSIGSVVSNAVGKINHLYVKEMPRSGHPDELLKKYGIDSSAIIKGVLR
ncbi:transketolase [Candidatus Woesearchaeota archaeon]|nr:transketolase [Candidatus Woesearchaeota archaeon]